MIFTLSFIVLTSKAADCGDGKIPRIQLRRHTASCLYLHCDVLIGRDTVGLSQLQHRGYSWVVSAHTHHPTAVIEGLKAAGGSVKSTGLKKVIVTLKHQRRDHSG